MSTDLVTLDSREPIGTAESLMALGQFRHLPVLRDGQFVGLVTHRDLLRGQAQQAQDPQPLMAGRIMTKDVMTVTPETPVLQAARLIYERKLGCLPVVADRRLVGITTEADFVHLVIRGLERLEEAAGEEGSFAGS